MHRAAVHLLPERQQPPRGRGALGVRGVHRAPVPRALRARARRLHELELLREQIDKQVPPELILHAQPCTAAHTAPRQRALETQ